MKNKITVAMLLTNAFHPDPRVFKEASSLVRAGYQVHVICWDRLDEFPELEDFQGIVIHRIKIHSQYSSGSKQLLYLPRFWVRAIQALNHIQPDIIHCHDLDTTIVGAYYSKWHNIPWLFDAHECYPEQIRHQVNRIIYYILTILERYMASDADRVITIGEELAKHLSVFTTKVSIIGNYPELNTFDSFQEEISRFKLGIPMNALVVTYIGGFTRERAILPLIDASHNNNNVYILLIGDGPQRKIILDAISGHDYINYLGWVPHDHVPSYMHISDVIYYGLTNEDGNSQYSTPNTLFNAMAAGKPILTTAIGEISRIVNKEACGVVIPRATHEFITVGLQALSNLSTRKIYGENSRKAAIEKYNWGNADKILLNIYKSVIN
jgi:glycosyltransferase involved in cell wall biosynthesis